MSTPNPAIYRRRLRTELRSLRQAAGLTQEQVATRMEWSLSKLIRIESGSVAISRTDLRAVLQLYAVDDERADELLELARGARERTWWSKYRDVLSNADYTYLEYESSATLIREFQPFLIPSLLQTEDYARVLLTDGLQISPEIIDKRISLLMERQALLERVNSPQLKVVLDEAVMRRAIGGSDLMRRQLEHLLGVARLPNVYLQILPFAAGATPALRGGFIQLEFEGFADSVVWIENSSRLSSDDTEDTAHYLETFMQLERLALRPDDSATMLERVMEDLSVLDEYAASTSPDPGDYLDQHFVL